MDSEIEKRIQQLHEQIIASISLQRIKLLNYATKKDITQVLDNNFEVLQKFAKSIDGEFKNVKSKLGEQASSQKENMELIGAAINSIATIKAQIFQIKALLGGREKEIEKKIKEIEKTLKNLLEKEKININSYADQLRDKAEKNHQHKEYSLKTDLVNLEKKLEKRNNTEQYAQKIQKLEANIENDKKELQNQIILEKTLNKSSIDSINQKLVEKAEIDHEHDQYTLYSDFETEVKKLKEEIKKKKRPINYITDGGVTSAKILDGTIVNDDISALAGIEWGKIDKAGSNLTDIATRNFSDLLNRLAQYVDVTDTGNYFTATDTEGTLQEIGGNYFKNNGNSFGTSALIGTNDNNSFGIETNGTTKLTVLANGNVGIGTSSPDVLIHGRGTNPAFAVSSSSGGNFAKLMSGSGGSVFYFRNDKYFAIVPTGSVTDTGGAGSTSFYMDGATGKIGIGNTNPGAKLQIDTGAASTIGAIIKGAASQSANLQQWRNSSDTVLSYVDSAGQIIAPGVASDIFKDSNLNSYLSITGASPSARSITLGSTIIADTITLNTKTSGLINLNGASTIIASDSATNSVTNTLTAGHNTSGTPASGYGTGLLFTGESSTTPDRLMGRIKTYWLDPADATRTSKMILSTYDLATEKEVLTLDENGNVGINNTSPTSTIHILSQSDTIGLIVKGSASQTTDYFKITDSSGSSIVYLNKTGELITFLSYDASVDAPSVNYSPSSLYTTLQLINDGNYGNNTAAANYQLDIRVGSNRTTYGVIAGAAYRGAGSGHNYMAGGLFSSYVESTSEEVVTTAVGGLFSVTNASNRAAYADNLVAGDFEIYIGCNRSVTATSAIFLNVRSITEFNTNMAVTTVYGIKIADQDVGTTNYAIYTGAGSIVFNSGYDANTDFTVGSDSYDAIYVDASNNATYIMTNASGKISFFGASPVAQQSELTDELTTITHTAPGTPDYAIQDLTNVAPYGFVTQEEGNTVLSVIANLQARVNEVETKLVAYGLLPDAD